MPQKFICHSAQRSVRRPNPRCEHQDVQRERGAEQRERGATGGMSEVEHSFGAFTELKARTNAGEEVSFSQFAGKVVLAVNVARL